ncbi:MAG: MiaB/RimO family radical SAM methylthiotransferase [Pyrinomonadaceae bacterium]|nr:MiaB/RimO family radical SAM methylthiotransferase [Pyrinomonadaceae bacterium]
MNVSDSERVNESLIDAGYQIVRTSDAADVVLFNTCSVREKAENKLYSRIGEIRSYAAENSTISNGQPIIGVLGCVAQLEGENLLKHTNKIDFVLGTKAVGRIGRIIADVIETNDAQPYGFPNPNYTDGSERIFPIQPSPQKQFLDLGERESDYDWRVKPDYRTSKHISYIPIIEGCNKFCTYCIVPFSRGREQSRLSADILRDVTELKNEGIREIHLIGQNVNSYRPKGDDHLANYKGATPFSGLLRAVAETGIERIKFTTSFPRDFHTDIISAINEHENLCNWVHLPVQSGSDNVLRTMRRGHTISAYQKQIDEIKSSPRRIALTSDLIVGFPGETESDFQETLKLVESNCFDALFIFKYSPRRGTPAASLDDDVSWKDKQTRFITLESAQRRAQSLNWRENHVGQILQVLAERTSTKNPCDLTGHSTCQKIVNFKAPQSSIGRVVKVLITEVKINSLYGVSV